MRAAGLLLTLLLAVAAPPADAAEQWRWPLRGPVVGPFDYSSAQPFAGGQHRGVDIAAPAGTTVRAACRGRVVFAGTAGSSGRTVSVRCGPLLATYLHLRSVAVRAGRTVGAGDRLGEVGGSGQPRLRVPHLHLGARLAARRWGYVDPLALLGEGPAPDAGPLPGPRRFAPPVMARVPRGLGRAPAPLPAPVKFPARVPARPRPVVVRAPSQGMPWPVWVGAALLALAIPLPVMRRRRRTTPERSVARRAIARG
jgi:murein DD-endopeptidase MepM/ murein hydrolase activator NlpD